MLPLDELFDVVIDSSEVGMRKPDPRIFALALDRAGRSAPARAVFLDDYPGNIAARRGAAACTACWSTADYHDAIAQLDRSLGRLSRPVTRLRRAGDHTTVKHQSSADGWDGPS